MAHFASVNWNNPVGNVASLTKASVTAATGTSSTEGTDKLTYTAERAGLYRINVYAQVVTAGTGASQAVVAQVAYTDATGAKSAADIAPSGVTVTKLDLTSGTATLKQSTVIYSNNAATITVTMSGSGTFTSAGVYGLYIIIEAV